MNYSSMKVKDAMLQISQNEIAQLRTQLARPDIGVCCLWGGKTPGDHERWAEGQLDCEFVPEPLWRLRHGLQ